MSSLQYHGSLGQENGRKLITQALNSVFSTPLFFAAIVISTWYGGAGLRLAAVLIASVLLDDAFVPPLHRFEAGEWPYLTQSPSQRYSPAGSS